MKAWIVWSGPKHEPECWAVLVFAPTRHKARSMCVGYYDWDDAYIYMHAYRLPKMDGATDELMVLDSASDDPLGLIEKSGIYAGEDLF